MPVAQSRGHAGKALIIAAVSVVLLLGLAFVVAQAASRGDVKINLGDDRFDAGKVENIAKAIDAGQGLPILYGDLVGKGRNLFVHHTGRDPQTGWTAFGAFDPDKPSCAITIDRARRMLVDQCDPHRTYPNDGTGLRFYPATVEGGHLEVNLNQLSTTTSPTTAPSSTTGAERDLFDQGRLIAPGSAGYSKSGRQLGLLDLVGAGAGQVVDGDEALGHLVVGQPLGGPGRQVGGLQRDVGSKADDRGGHLAEPFVGQPDDGGLEHVGVLLQGVLHLQRVDRVPAVLDDVLAPALEHQQPERPLPGQVPGAEPTVRGEHRRGGLLVAPVRREDAGALHLQLADLAARHLGTLVVDDTHLVAG